MAANDCTPFIRIYYILTTDILKSTEHTIHNAILREKWEMSECQMKKQCSSWKVKKKKTKKIGFNFKYDNNKYNAQCIEPKVKCFCFNFIAILYIYFVFVGCNSLLFFNSAIVLLMFANFLISFWFSLINSLLHVRATKKRAMLYTVNRLNRLH